MKPDENSKSVASADVRTAVSRRAPYEKPSLMSVELSAVVRSSFTGSPDAQNFPGNRT